MVFLDLLYFWMQLLLKYVIKTEQYRPEYTNVTTKKFPNVQKSSEGFIGLKSVKLLFQVSPCLDLHNLHM